MASNTSSGSASGGGGGGGAGGTTWYDQYGNAYTGNLTVNSAGWYGAQGGVISPNTVLTYPGNYSIGTTSHSIQWNPPLKVDSLTLSRAQVSDLVDEMTTRIQPGEKVVICLEYSVTDEQMHELRRILDDLHVEGVLVRQARAAIPPLPMPFSAREQRVDYLARILDLWEQRPGLLLTDLLAFYQGQQMGDNEFITAVETHFQLGLA